jgi:hypothetical protein
MRLRLATFGFAGPLALAIALVLTGCGHTLVFAEQTGFNLSIIAKSSEATPLNVNLGLDRSVGSVVPPIHENTAQGLVDGEGVNMFAGFAAQYDSATQPLAGNLRIRTQFASGQAALAITGDPDAVVRVVNVSDIPLGALTPDSIRPQILPLRRKIRSLSDPQIFELARELGLIKPNEALSRSEAESRIGNELDLARQNVTDFGTFKDAVDKIAGK